MGIISDFLGFGSDDDEGDKRVYKAMRDENNGSGRLVIFLRGNQAVSKAQFRRMSPKDQKAYRKKQAEYERNKPAAKKYADDKKKGFLDLW